MNRWIFVPATMLVAASGLAGCTVQRETRVIRTTREPVPTVIERRSAPTVVEHRPVVRHDVVVERPPMPAPRVEVRTVAPGPTYHWIDGHYEWNGRDWQWSPGYWAP